MKTESTKAFPTLNEWLPLLARGEHFARTIFKLFVVGEPEIDLIIAEFGRESKRSGFGGVLVDVNHSGQAAAGWLMEMRKTGNGLEGRIVWTPLGRDLVETGQYRYFSFGLEAVELEEGSGRWHPARIEHLTLTNRPQIRQAPISLPA